jgi:hypothetical protein
MNMNGEWEGTIVYGKEYKGHAGKELFFEMYLTHDFDTIIGESVDVAGVGVSPDKATIKGTVSKNTINFIKQYETHHYFEGRETMIDSTRKGPEIEYMGMYNPLDKIFMGKWKIQGEMKLFGMFPFTFNSTGIWTMKRINDI